MSTEVRPGVQHGPLLAPASPADCQRLHRWRNNAWLVSLSAARRRVGWDEHVAWFKRILADPATLLWVVEPDAGSVRIERKGEIGWVSIYLLRRFTRRGWGPLLLREACGQAFGRWPLGSIRAHVREDNAPSRKAFGKAGFVDGEGQGGLREMVLWRND